ncbi:MAG: lipopolysaccharide heptosyltransferase family protein, partial [Candidatus Electrothrix sp. ATG2]|nr:lipopolysaccharide heptosyltransferase family protein [Candidatus Electrothrix sp. ATG2]
HPTSAELSKNWLPQRFLTLAARLQAKGFEPVFIMSAAEEKDWQPIISDRFSLRSFAGVDQCAAFLYESGFFIGNDSGGGHLASCLDIPVLSIHGRKGKARVWRPGWGQVEVVTPLLNVIGGSLRQHLWKYFLSVSAVERGFERLIKNNLS